MQGFEENKAGGDPDVSPPSSVEYRITRIPHVLAGSDGSTWLKMEHKVDSSGYERIYVGRNLATNEKNRILVHRLILETFVGEAPDGMIGRHLDGSRNNNQVSNLAWGTHKDNSDDKDRHGRLRRGSDVPQSKLTETQVAEIRLLIAEGTMTAKRIAKLVGVETTVIYSIANRKRWTHVP